MAAAMALKRTPATMKQYRRRSSIVRSLPHDLLIDVAMRIATKSSTPMKDILSLEATCKEFFRASTEKMVRRSLVVDRDWTMCWREKDSYLGLLQDCADCGNLDAEFVLGVEEFYNSRKAISGLEHLQRAMDGGHLTAAYFLGLVLFRHLATQSAAMEILNRVSSGDLSAAADVTDCTRTGNPTVDRCRKKLLQTIRKNWKKEWVLERGLPCDDRHCGRVEQAKCSEEFWVEDDRLPRAFCSQECRWMYEAKTFFENI